MSRIKMLNTDVIPGERLQMPGTATPNSHALSSLKRVFANSPVALRAFLGLRVIAEDGSLSLKTRQRIALAMAQQASCEYTISAYLFTGRQAGLTGDEMAINRKGSSEDANASVGVKLALGLAARGGDVSDAELEEARYAGYTDADLAEIVAHVGMHILLNIMCKASDIKSGISTAAPARDRHEGK